MTDIELREFLSQPLIADIEFYDALNYAFQRLVDVLGRDALRCADNIGRFSCR